jgi:hypothetical protein
MTEHCPTNHIKTIIPKKNTALSKHSVQDFDETWFSGCKLLLYIQDHTQALHSWWDSPERVISPTQGPLPGNTPQSQSADTHAPNGFEPASPASERNKRSAFSIIRVNEMEEDKMGHVARKQY